MKKSLILLIALVTITGLLKGEALGDFTVMLPLILNSAGGGVDGKFEYGVDFISAADSPADSARYQKAISTGAGWNRWPLYWYNVETSSGVFDWSYGDPVVQADLANGFQTELILMGTPGFYASGGSADAPLPQVGRRPDGWEKVQDTLLAPASPTSTTPQGLYTSVFQGNSDIPGPGKEINDENRWAVFVFKAIEHYGPMGITHYEIWNEQDYDFFWTGTVADYARLLKVAYLAAEQADPNAQIIFGGLANFQQPNFFADLMAIYAGDPLAPDYNWFFDILATHSYSTSWQSWLHVWRADRTLGNYGLEKDIWLNESGSPAWDDYPGPTWDPNSGFRSTMQEGAAYIIQSAMYAKYAGASVIFHFQLYDDCGNCPAGSDFPPERPDLCTPDGSSCLCAGDAFGLFRNRTDADCYRQHPEPDTPRPALDAFQVLADHLTGLEPLWRQRPGGSGPYDGTQEWIAFYRPSTGERVLGLWSLVGSGETAVVPATGESALLIDQAGTITPLTPSDGVYTLQLEPASNQNASPASGSAYAIGGPPLILIETDTDLPQVTVHDLPAIAPPGIAVSWSGEDLGSGVRDYDLWVFQDGITMTSWLTDTTAEYAIYVGQAGKSYGFAATGRDWANNENAPPAGPQVATTVGIAQVYLPLIITEK